jgi:hypothetical protein
MTILFDAFELPSPPCSFHSMYARSLRSFTMSVRMFRGKNGPNLFLRSSYSDRPLLASGRRDDLPSRFRVPIFEIGDCKLGTDLCETEFPDLTFPPDLSCRRCTK